MKNIISNSYKKILTFILCILLITVSFSGCGSNTNKENWGYYDLYEGVTLVRVESWDEDGTLKIHLTDKGYINSYVFENGYRTICRLDTTTGEIISGANGRAEKFEVMNNDQVKIGSIGSSNITDRYIYGKNRLVLYTYEPDFGSVHYYYLVLRDDIDWVTDLSNQEKGYIYKKLRK